jgi:Protein of unknown function (DUF2000).
METVPQHVVVVVDAGLPRGVLANTVAAISIGLGAASPASGGAPLEDCDHQRVHAVSERGVPVLGAGQTVLGDVFRRALPTPDGGIVVPFPLFARRIPTFEEYRDSLTERHLRDEPLAGLGLIGPERWVRSLTGSLGLLH